MFPSGHGFQGMTLGSHAVGSMEEALSFPIRKEETSLGLGEMLFQELSLDYSTPSLDQLSLTEEKPKAWRL